MGCSQGRTVAAPSVATRDAVEVPHRTLLGRNAIADQSKASHGCAGQREARVESLFYSLDLDCSGSLKKSELVALCNETVCYRGDDAADVLERSCDANKDGEVSMDEWKAMFRKEAARKEEDLVELLQEFEQAAMAQRDKRVESLFRRVDLDCNGSLEKCELFAFCGVACAARLERLCGTKKNGKVTMDEWKAMFATEAARSERGVAELLSVLERASQAKLTSRIADERAALKFEQAALAKQAKREHATSDKGLNTSWVETL